MSVLRSAAAAVLVVSLAGCGSHTTKEASASTPSGGDEPLTPRALAAVVAEHTGTPSSAQLGTDMEEFGRDVVAVELRYGAGAETDGDSLSVGVGTDFVEVVGNCGSPQNEGLAGCVKTADGMVLWEDETPEEDPGVVYVLASKRRADVILYYSGPPITGDPRRLDLPISVEEMFAIAADPRVDVTTSREAIEAGNELDVWRGR